MNEGLPNERTQPTSLLMPYFKELANASHITLYSRENRLEFGGRYIPVEVPLDTDSAARLGPLPPGSYLIDCEQNNRNRPWRPLFAARADGAGFYGRAELMYNGRVASFGFYQGEFSE